MINDVKAIGKNIREIRKKRGLTIHHVAKATGIDIATLSRMETGKMTGTLESHLAIARALGVGLPEILSKAFGAIVASGGEDDSSAPFHHGASPSALSEPLSGRNADKKMTPVRLSLKSGAETPSESLPLGTERFLYVLQGKVNVRIKNDVYPVQENGSIYFNGSAPHSFKNPQKRTATALLVTSP